MRKTTQLTIQIANRAGVLSKLVSALWKKGVNIRAFKGDVCNGKVTIHLIVNKPAAARQVLADHADGMLAHVKGPKGK